MSFLQKMKSSVTGLRHHALTERHGSGWNNGTGLGGFAVDKAVRYGASYGWGVAKGYFHDRMMLFGKAPADLTIGGAMVLVGALGSAATSGKSVVAAHLERVGDAGVQSYLNTIGASRGAKLGGRSVLVLDEGKKRAGVKTALKGDTVLGMIPPAMGGSYLSADEIAAYAQKR